MTIPQDILSRPLQPPWLKPDVQGLECVDPQYEALIDPGQFHGTHRRIFQDHFPLQDRLADGRRTAYTNPLWVHGL